MKFKPEEILFAPSSACNLKCAHCGITRTKGVLSPETARKFLRGCKKFGIERLGFTGGEPFLARGFLIALVKTAIREGMLFDRITTNGVWYRKENDLAAALSELRKAGYDGSILLSIDAFHGQDLKKAGHFISTASAMWRRPDFVSIAYVRGARDEETGKKIAGLSRILNGRLIGFGGPNAHIKTRRLFLKIYGIELSPIGKAVRLKNPWGDKEWFRDDFCKGPGNVLFVLPDGSVKPCCGYATDCKELTIGNIKKDSIAKIIANVGRNAFVSTIFKSGLSALRKRLERSGVKFPGRTANHCYFCWYILTKIPKRTLNKCLD